MIAPSPVLRQLSFALLIAAIAAVTANLAAQIPSRNVNMVSGTEWPGGDPFLQRQNEGSVAVSTRNPLHLVAGSNDYRSVDLPGVETVEEVGDAWVGLYTSTDAGDRWTSTLVPGYPQEPLDSPGRLSPLFGYNAAADPVVRAGTNGLIYYAGLVFDRTSDLSAAPGKSAIFVARLIDNNNQEAPDPDQHLGPFEYIGATLVTSNTGANGVFLDKPWMAVDIPRSGAATCPIVTNNEHGPFTQQIPAGNIYVAFTMKSTDNQGDRWDLYFSRSTNCGVTFSSPLRISRTQDRVNQGAHIVIAPTTGNVYVSWRRIDLAADNVEEHAIVVAKSTDKGNHFDPPGVARRFPRGQKKGLNPAFPPGNGNGQGKKAGSGLIQASEEFELVPFDQSTSAFDKTFRSRAYPTMTADGTGRLYLAWAERGFATAPGRTDPNDGDARILLTTSTDGAVWTTPQVVADVGQMGHQIMPALSFAGGKLMLAYYDLQEDRSQVFTKFVDDRTAFEQTSPDHRHTIDLRVSMAEPGASPVFQPSRSVSQYMQGTRDASLPLEQLQVNAPNLTMFRQGTVPFMGDYIDLAPSPAFVTAANGSWIYNTAPGSLPPMFHAVWTDNRDVKPPFDKDWRHYTAPYYPGLRPNPEEPVTVCLPGYAGSRNQNLYTARITGGLVVGSPQNSKQLSATLQRAFVVFAQNTTESTKTFRMTILNQPLNGRASFSQFPLPPFTPSSAPPVTFVDLTIPKFTSASRTVYVTSTDPHSRVNVDVSETQGVGQPETPGGLDGVITLNGDVLNPEVDNPEVDNPEVDNPEVDNDEVYNPEVDNPEVDNPEVDNPEVDNPEVDNPEVDNIVIGNPEVDNPEVDNPEVDNPEVDNPEVDNPEVDNAALIAGGGVISDVTWTIKNIGNTTTAYDVNVFLRHNTLPTGRAQLLIYRVYKTPIITMTTCNVQTVTQNVLTANIPDPRLIPPGGQPSDPNDSDRTNATVWIEPEQVMRVTLRIFDPIKADNVIVDGASIDPDWVPEADVSLLAQSQPVNTPDAPFTTEPPLVGADPLTTFTVTNTASTGPGSIREAMLLAEATPGMNIIAFNIPGAGVHTIAPQTPLPDMNEPVIIDGSTQPGYAGLPLIELDGVALPGGGSGLRLFGGGSTVRGLVIGRFGDAGIDLEGNNNEIYGNYIGVDATGTVQHGNGNGGIFMTNSSFNRIGRPGVLDRNVISGNAFWGVLLSASSNNSIEGNYIGLDASGNAGIPNSYGLAMQGGVANAVRNNIISGNFADGALVSDDLDTFTGNRIGTNAAGLAAVANGGNGIQIISGQNTVGGVLAGEGNLISGNTGPGILLSQSAGNNPTGTQVLGNLIGTNIAGTAAIANQAGIHVRAHNITIGKPGGGRNVISGNSNDGIFVGDSIVGSIVSINVAINGNYIGTDVTGTLDLGNVVSGISVTNGSSINIGDSTVPGGGNLISGNNGGGIRLAAASSLVNSVVTANLIGTTATGNAALPNIGHGINVVATGGSVANVIIGGVLPEQRNVIGANTFSGVNVNGANVATVGISGNYIGVGADGSTDLGNGISGVNVSNAVNTLIGGSGGARNIISGNSGYGVSANDADSVMIAGNYIGTNAAGTAAVANGAGGVSMQGAGMTNAVIGTLTAGNVISGNGGFAGIGLQNIPGATVQGNFIGINAAGTAALGNNLNGIDADTAGVLSIEGNVVSGNSANGIYVVAGISTWIKSNIAGLDAVGNTAIPNGNAGIFTEFLNNVIIGKDFTGAGGANTVSGNTLYGIRLNAAPGMQVRGNFVGTDVTGTVARPNGSAGISVNSNTSSGTIGGDQPATRNVISGNTAGHGVDVTNATNLFIEGNYIGVDATGTVALGNSVGVAISGGTNVGVGDTPAGQFNVISGNTIGVLLSGGSGNRVESNFIGNDETGLIGIPNGDGVIAQGTAGSTLVTGNRIALNTNTGVSVLGSATGITIASRIFSNGGQSIDLGGDGVTTNDVLDADGGPNLLQNYPVVSGVTTTSVGGDLFSAPGDIYTIRFYVSNVAGEALTQIASVNVPSDAGGHAVIPPQAVAIASGQFVTATATDSSGNTSELSVAVIVP